MDKNRISKNNETSRGYCDPSQKSQRLIGSNSLNCAYLLTGPLQSYSSCFLPVPKHSTEHLASLHLPLTALRAENQMAKAVNSSY